MFPALLRVFVLSSVVELILMIAEIRFEGASKIFLGASGLLAAV